MSQFQDTSSDTGIVCCQKAFGTLSLLYISLHKLRTKLTPPPFIR